MGAAGTPSAPPPQMCVVSAAARLRTASPMTAAGPLPRGRADSEVEPQSGDGDVGAGPPRPVQQGAEEALRARIASLEISSDEHEKLRERIRTLEDSLQRLGRESLERAKVGMEKLADKYFPKVQQYEALTVTCLRGGGINTPPYSVGEARPAASAGPLLRLPLAAPVVRPTDSGPATLSMATGSSPVHVRACCSPTRAAVGSPGVPGSTVSASPLMVRQSPLQQRGSLHQDRAVASLFTAASPGRLVGGGGSPVHVRSVTVQA